MSFRQSIFRKNFSMYRQSSTYTVLKQHGFLNNTVYFGTLICPFSTKSLFRLHGFLLTRLIFQSLKVSKKTRKERTPCTLDVQIILLRKEKFICLFIFVFFYTVQKTQLMMVAKNTAMKLAQHYYVCLLLTHTYCPFIKTHDPEM